jgi:two-component system, OmpR family, phosphate regulon response regulator PhoB
MQRVTGAVERKSLMSKLLIVDDESGVRSLIRMTLECPRYDIQEAENAKEALDVARLWKPDLILLDVMLPDGSGFEVCRELKADPDTAATNVVMLTAKAQRADFEEGQSAGADDYFPKPFSPIALLRKVESVLGEAI